MEVHASRLRRGEWIAAVSALLLLVFMFVPKWYGTGPAGSVSGWDELTHLRWLALVTIVFALGLAFLQATRRSPALPVSMSVIVTVLAVINAAWLGYRVLISVPPDEKISAYLGLASAIGIAVGGYLSMRQEGISTRDARTEVETVALSGHEAGPQ